MSVMDLTAAMRARLSAEIGVARGGNAGFSLVVSTVLDGGVSRAFAVNLERDGGLTVSNGCPQWPNAEFHDTDESGALCGEFPDPMASRPLLCLSDGGSEIAPTLGTCRATSGPYWAGSGAGGVFVARRGASFISIPRLDGGPNQDTVVGITGTGAVVVTTVRNLAGEVRPRVAVELFGVDGGGSVMLPDLGSSLGATANAVSTNGHIAGSVFGANGQRPALWEQDALIQLEPPEDNSILEMAAVSDDGEPCGFFVTTGGAKHGAMWVGVRRQLVDTRQLGLGVTEAGCFGALPGGRFIVMDYTDRSGDGGSKAAVLLVRLTQADAG